MLYVIDDTLVELKQLADVRGPKNYKFYASIPNAELYYCRDGIVRDHAAGTVDVNVTGAWYIDLDDFCSCHKSARVYCYDFKLTGRL